MRVRTSLFAIAVVASVTAAPTRLLAQGSTSTDKPVSERASDKPASERGSDKPVPDKTGRPARSPRGERAGLVADRIAVRFATPETGGMARPRFITDRELALFARFEAMMEQVPMPETEYPERYVRSAMDRLVARAMLASLLMQRGQEPTDLPRLTAEGRAELADRVGGTAALDQALKREGIEDDELAAMLRDQARAAWYIDKAITPVSAVTEDSLREAFRSGGHPYRGMKYDDVRLRLRRWVAAERVRATELEFLQSARSRVTIAAVTPVIAASGSSVGSASEFVPMPPDTVRSVPPR